MRIDLPRCNFKNCKYHLDCNCTSQKRYETCDFREVKDELEKLKAEKPVSLDEASVRKGLKCLVEHQDCVGCKYRVEEYFCNKEQLSTDAIALLDNKDAEIEQLNSIIKEDCGMLPKYEKYLGNKTRKEFAERLKAEITTRIEELKATKSKYVKENYKCLSCDYIAKIRGKIEFLDGIRDFIDNLVKETEGIADEK